MNQIYVTLIFICCVVVAWQVAAEDDKRISIFKNKAALPTVTDSLYINECGDCHMPYAPELLPARSWRRLMADLGDHFGDNAEISSADATKIQNYLVANSADFSNARLAHKFNRSLSAKEVPLRITQMRYFRREHSEIPNRIIRRAKLSGLSQCDACHRRANKGSFSEREINIPGTGVWDD